MAGPDDGPDMRSRAKRVLEFIKARMGVGESRRADLANLLRSARRQWDAARTAAVGGPKVLIATTVTGFSHVTTIESLLGVALTLRGAEVHYLVCDGVLPGCLRAEIENVPRLDVFEQYGLPKEICPSCMAQGRRAYEPLGLPIHRLGASITADEAQEARNAAGTIASSEMRGFAIDDLALGEHAYAGALRYFARGDVEGLPRSDMVVRRYLEASILAARGVRRLLASLGSLRTAVFHHGIYVPQGVIGEVCRERGTRVVNWNPSYRKNTFIFSHGNSYHHTLMDEPVGTWESMAWSPAREAEILAYLRSRITGARDWIWFHENPDENFDTFAGAMGLDPAKPTIGMLTNVMWDAQLHYPANAFGSMLEWVLETIRYFAKRPDLQLLMRVHPAEIRGTAPSRQPIIAEIDRAFPQRPANVFIIPPESPVSTYAAMARCDSVLIYGTKTGVELTSVGTPVIVGGEAWIRNKGLTLDARSRAEYFEFLDRLPLGRRMDPGAVARARKYAYHFFFRRMVPLPFVVPESGGIYTLALDDLDDLQPGAYPGLDVICNGILSGSPFVYEAEHLGLHDRET